MEPGLAAAAYTAETAAEATAGAALAISQPTLPLKAKWLPIPLHPPPSSLSRSSHTLSLLPSARAYLFGGEQQPRQPVAASLHAIALPSSGVGEGQYLGTTTTAAAAAAAAGTGPAARVGHTAVSIGRRVFVFGGRGGPEMAPLEEGGTVWVWDELDGLWSALKPVHGSPVPPARSYHAAAASEHPLPAEVSKGRLRPELEREGQLAEEGKGGEDVAAAAEASARLYGTVFVHAGCPAQGRLSDLWAFDVASRVWKRLPDAPGPARGGAMLALARDRLYRYGGFDGEKELGADGVIDYLELAKGTFDDKGGRGEAEVVAKRQEWKTVQPPEGSQAPGARSVAGLHAVTTGQGRNYLVLLLGEKEPSSKGHEGAGVFWDDVWAYQVRPEGMSGASFKDAARQLVGMKNYEGTWAKVEVPEASMEDGQHEKGPGARGWFASAAGGEGLGHGSVVVWGGLAGNGERLGDGWILELE